MAKSPPPWLTAKTKGAAAEDDSKGPKSGPVKEVRDMVSAHSKVPDEKKPGYRKKCIGKARSCGAMQHIPKAWLKKGD